MATAQQSTISINTIQEWQDSVNDIESTNFEYREFPSGGEGLEIDYEDGYVESHTYFLTEPTALRFNFDNRRATNEFTIYDLETGEALDSIILTGDTTGDIIVDGDIPDAFYYTIEPYESTQDTRVDSMSIISQTDASNDVEDSGLGFLTLETLIALIFLLSVIYVVIK